MHCQQVFSYLREKGNHLDVEMRLSINIHILVMHVRCLFMASVIMDVRFTYPPIITSHVSISTSFACASGMFMFTCTWKEDSLLKYSLNFIFECFDHYQCEKQAFCQNLDKDVLIR